LEDFDSGDSGRFVRSRFDWPSTQQLTSPFYEPRRSNDQSVHYSRSSRTILGIFEESEEEREIHCSARTFQTLKSEVRGRYSRKPANPSSLQKLLVEKGAGAKCWVISENSELDGKEIDLQTALKETIGYQMGTFISCIPGKLAYFEDEDGRYILER
jgi:hypothetical protein